MDVQILLSLIDSSIKEIISYVHSFKEYNCNEQKETLLILLLMEDSLHKDTVVRKRLLRGFKDICTMTSINFEEASYYNSIFKIYSFLTENDKEFENLELLRLDYGKEFPI